MLISKFTRDTRNEVGVLNSEQKYQFGCFCMDQKIILHMLCYYCHDQVRVIARELLPEFQHIAHAK